MTLADDNYWQYDYDNLGQIKRTIYKDASDVAFPGRDFGFTFDDIGNRTQTDTNGRIAAYLPNDLNQYNRRQVSRALDVSGSAREDAIVEVNGSTTIRKGEYFYHELDLSADGNDAQQVDILAVATLPDGGDNDVPRAAEVEKSEYLTPNPESFKYDADGNLKQDSRWFYKWDAENRLVEMRTCPIARSAGVSGQKLEFAYDSQGRRFSKKVYDWDSASDAYLLTSEFLYLYDGWNLIFEVCNPESQIQTTKSFVWGTDLSGSLQGAGGVGGLLMVTDAEDLTYYPAFDGNGNVMGYYAADTGESIAEFEYGAFGELIRATGEKKDDFNFRFSTKYEDTETGLLYYGYRYYNPETGSWLSREPLGESESANLYTFIGNDGLNYFDILGLARGRPVTNRFTPRNVSPNAITLQNAYQSAVRNYNANPNRLNRDRLQRIIRRANEASVRLGPQQRPGSAIRNNPFLTPAERQAALREGIQQPSLLTRPGNSARDRLERQLAEAEIIRRELQTRCINGLGRVTGNFDTQNPGPLSRDLAGTFSGGRYREVILQSDTVFYRAGQSGKPLGQFFDTSPAGGILQARIDKAILPRWPGGGTSPIDTVFGVRVPAGARVYTGTVSSQGGVYIGGTQQVVIPRPWTINGVEVISSAPLQ